jgi:DNA invertase Pin-like site-specific DNA recombinase
MRPRLLRNQGPPPRSKRFLTACDVAEIVQKYESGNTTQEIGARYGISKTSVATVLREQGITIRRQGLMGVDRRAVDGDLVLVGAG